MAEVCIGRAELKQFMLPGVCIRCGGPASVWTRTTFTWLPNWTGWLLLAGVLPYFFLAILIKKKVVLVVPFCCRHRWHWPVRNLLALAGLAVLAIAFLIARQHVRMETLIAWFIAPVLLWLVSAGVLQETAIRATRITDESMTLKGVGPEFVSAMEAQRSARGRSANEPGSWYQWQEE